MPNERRQKRLKHKIRRDRYRELAKTPYYLKPGEIYQIPGTRYGVKRIDSRDSIGLVPIWFDKSCPSADTPSTT